MQAISEPRVIADPEECTGRGALVAHAMRSVNTYIRPEGDDSQKVSAVSIAKLMY